MGLSCHVVRLTVRVSVRRRCVVGLRGITDCSRWVIVRRRIITSRRRWDGDEAELASYNRLGLFVNKISISDMTNLARSGHAAEFHCRSAANRQKRRAISAVGRHGQNGLKRLITMRFPTPARQFPRAKTQLSAVDSGIGVGPRGGGGNGCAGDRTTKDA